MVRFVIVFALLQIFFAPSEISHGLPHMIKMHTKKFKLSLVKCVEHASHILLILPFIADSFIVRVLLLI